MWNNDGYDNNDNNNGSWNNDGYNGGGQGGGNNDDMWKHDGYDNSENNNGGGGNDDWVGDGHDDNYSGSVDYSDGDDDGSTYITADDQWTADGWTENNLGTNKSGNAAEGGDKVDPAPFILGALVAGVIGAAFVVTRVSFPFLCLVAHIWRILFVLIHTFVTVFNHLTLLSIYVSISVSSHIYIYTPTEAASRSR